MSNEVIKSFKGFDKDLKSRGFQYEIGKEYEEPKAEACKCGFHACEYPLDVFTHYAPNDSRYCEVEQSGDIDKSESDKTCSTKIKIGAEISIRGLVKAAIEYTRSRCTNENNAKPGEPATAGEYGAATAGYAGAATAGEYGAATAGYAGAATAGYAGAATAGNRGAATAGNRGAATAGEYGAATAGEYGAATAGYAGAATAGEYGAATAGNRGAATAGNRGAATAGNAGAATAGNAGAATAGYAGAATSRGRSCTGNYGVCVARGNGVMVKGGIGSLLVIAEEEETKMDIAQWKAVVVDGEIVKSDTWYKLIDGELKEVE